VFGENKDATVYTINGRTFDPLRIDLKVPLGSVEEWTVVNDTPDFHEFHIHQLGFQLTEINHAQQAFAGFVDDVRVPEHGEVKLLIPFTDPVMVGHVMFHCHVLNHEDRGMMATLEIFRPGFLHICRVPNL
jgi:FtsP/CotA-like multicopper oxidase with cupredoxin domain